MTDRTIEISERTWRELRARRRGSEDVDDVLRRVLSSDPLAGVGAWSDLAIDEAVREVKAETDDDFDD